ncbi:MAG TPA: TIGR02391 family protein [Nitrosopumilaceae archaeon]|jgi:uncharacterized protein (TIGR02391 family)|nr:TIGR02391 family protein [Nitrosopumilaceae archaeon]
MNEVNFRLVATFVGNSLKYETSINEIDRFGTSILKILPENFSNSAITSKRAQNVFNWIMSLANNSIESSERIKRLIAFCLILTPEGKQNEIIDFLAKSGCPYNLLNKDGLDEFLKRNFHSEIVKHCQRLFLQKNYFHAVFEASKTFNNEVKIKSKSEKDGQALMLEVWGCNNGVLKVTHCTTQTDKDFQDGIKFISGGLMSAIRNPTAHEPAIEWPINKQDCLDILSLISFLFRQLDKATYFKI